MTNMRKIAAHKRRDAHGDYNQPLTWNVAIKPKFVFHKIEFAGDVETDDGTMKLARITSICELANPNVDVACLIANTVDPWSPEIWFWDNRFWQKAVDNLAVDYYRLKCYALYEVEVANRDELLSLLGSE